MERTGVRAFIHLDFGLVAVFGQFQAQLRADEVKKDLEDFRLLISEEKCSWTVSQVIEWTGWRIDTAEFKIYVTERKFIKAERKLDQCATQSVAGLKFLPLGVKRLTERLVPNSFLDFSVTSSTYF